MPKTKTTRFKKRGLGKASDSKHVQKTIITQPSSTARQQQDLYVRFVKQVNGWDVIQVNETQAKNELSSTRLQKHIAPRLSAIYPCEIYGVHAARF